MKQITMIVAAMMLLLLPATASASDWGYQMKPWTTMSLSAEDGSPQAVEVLLDNRIGKKESGVLFFDFQVNLKLANLETGKFGDPFADYVTLLVAMPLMSSDGDMEMTLYGGPKLTVGNNFRDFSVISGRLYADMFVYWLGLRVIGDINSEGLAYSELDLMIRPWQSADKRNYVALTAGARSANIAYDAPRAWVFGVEALLF